MKLLRALARVLHFSIPPPSLPSFLSTPRGLSRRRHFTHVEQLPDSAGRNYHFAKPITGAGIGPKTYIAHIVKEKENRAVHLCVSLWLQERVGRVGAPSARCSPRLGTRLTRAGRSTPFEDADSAPEVAANDAR